MIKVQIYNINIFTRILTNFRHKIVGRIIQGICPHGHQYMKTMIVSDVNMLETKLYMGHPVMNVLLSISISMLIYTYIIVSS